MPPRLPLPISDRPIDPSMTGVRVRGAGGSVHSRVVARSNDRTLDPPVVVRNEVTDEPTKPCGPNRIVRRLGPQSSPTQNQPHISAAHRTGAEARDQVGLRPWHWNARVDPHLSRSSRSRRANRPGAGLRGCQPVPEERCNVVGFADRPTRSAIVFASTMSVDPFRTVPVRVVVRPARPPTRTRSMPPCNLDTQLPQPRPTASNP